MEYPGSVTDEADPADLVMPEGRADFTCGGYQDEATSALARSSSEAMPKCGVLMCSLEWDRS